MPRRLWKKNIFGKRNRPYFVDFTGGNDSNNGRSPGTAWKTVAKVNAATFHPGAVILFKRGETWDISAAAALTVPRSNLTFAAYGTGANPIIDGGDAVNCIVTSSVSDITFRDMHVTQGLDFGFYNVGASGVSILNCEADNCGNDGIIFITGCSNCYVTGSSSHDNYERVVGPLTTGIEVSDGSHDVTIADCVCNDNEGAGVSIHSHIGTGMPYNITLTRVTCDSNRDYGVRVLKQDATVDTDRNIVITDCSGTGQTSALVTINGGLIMTQNAGAGALQGITITRFISFGNTQRPLYTNAKNVTMNRCVFAGTGTTSDNDNQFNAALNIGLNNCVFYMLDGLPIDIRGVSDGIHFLNCIIMRTGTAGGVAEVITTTNVTFDYCLYKPQAAITTGQWRWGGSYYSWANWLANTGQDAHSPTPADPTFVNATTGDFTLQAGSPAIDAGVVISGITDGYLGLAPDCGYAEKA